MKYLTPKAILCTLLPCLIMLLTGCHSQSKDERYNNMTPLEIYQTGVKHVNKHNYPEAIDDFTALESRYPFSEFADRAQMGAIYATYLNEDYVSALPAIDRFLRMYPRHPDVDWVYYMKGVIHFNESMGFFGKYLSGNEERDPVPAQQGFEAFSMLAATYPDSCYTPDAVLRMVYLRNVLAAHEMVAARYYMKRGAYVAAVKRANNVLEKFDQTPCVPDALALMIEAYRCMGMEDLADDTFHVLAYNYPTSKYVPRMS